MTSIVYETDLGTRTFIRTVNSQRPQENLRVSAVLKPIEIHAFELLAIEFEKRHDKKPSAADMVRLAFRCLYANYAQTEHFNHSEYSDTSEELWHLISGKKLDPRELLVEVAANQYEVRPIGGI